MSTIGNYHEKHAETLKKCLNAISAAEDIISIPNTPRSPEQVWDAAIHDWLNNRH